jgi:hypothetical protein
MAQVDQAGAEDAELAALEALADEIQAEAWAEPDDDQPNEQTAAVSDAAEGPACSGGGDGPWVRDCWEQATDLNSGRPYWFNRATGVSSWFPPAPWGSASAAAGPQPQHPQAPAGPVAAAGEAGAAQPAQHPQSDRTYKPGLYYRDAFQQLQGPFTLDQLREWRGMLPMNLTILRREAVPEGGSGGAGTGEERQRQTDGVAPGSKGGGTELAWAELELAGVLGDEDLLERWRLENPEQVPPSPPLQLPARCSRLTNRWHFVQAAALADDHIRPFPLPQAAWPGSAPPATLYEAERQRGTAHSLAQAVLYGLPAHDEAVGVARLAAASGRSISEVLEWGRAQQADYTSTAYRVAARGRIQAPGEPVREAARSVLRCIAGVRAPWRLLLLAAVGWDSHACRCSDTLRCSLAPWASPRCLHNSLDGVVQEPLYAEVSSWANPHELGEQLARAAQRRKRTLTPEELRAVKQRKKELKEKKMRAWLAD